MSYLGSLDPDEVVQQALERRALIKRIVKEAFQEGVHYGSATGQAGGKPSLLKPGADDAIQMLGLSPDYEVVEARGDGEKAPHLSVNVRCKLSSPTGAVVSMGCAAANTFEKKWRYRKAEIECPECGEPAVIKGREEYGGGWLCFKKKGGCGKKFPESAAFDSNDRVENPDPWDLANSIVKYAEKRAEIDAVLKLGFSAYFTQDPPVRTGRPSATPEPATQEDDHKQSEDLAGEVRKLSEAIAAQSGEPWADVLALASSFTSNGKSHCITPASLGRTSDKWLTSTLNKLKKRATEARLASHASTDAPF